MPNNSCIDMVKGRLVEGSFDTIKYSKNGYGLGEHLVTPTSLSNVLTGKMRG